MQKQNDLITRKGIEVLLNRFKNKEPLPDEWEKHIDYYINLKARMRIFHEERLNSIKSDINFAKNVKNIINGD